MKSGNFYRYDGENSSAEKNTEVLSCTVTDAFQQRISYFVCDDCGLIVEKTEIWAQNSDVERIYSVRFSVGRGTTVGKTVVFDEIYGQIAYNVTTTIGGESPNDECAAT